MSYKVPGGPWPQYAVLTIGVAQTVFTNGSHAEFNTVTNFNGMPSSLVTVTTGTGQSNGTVTLASQRWLIWTYLYQNISTGFMHWLWQTSASGTLNDESGTPVLQLQVGDNTATDATGMAVDFMILSAVAGSLSLKLNIIEQTGTAPGSLVCQVFCMPLT